MKNWTGDENSVFKTLGASNHVDHIRECNDFYATEPKATELLLELESFNNKILEPACGDGCISKVLMQRDFDVLSSDLIDRNFGVQKDFFKYTKWDGDIITNPPYKYAKEFVEHSLKITPKGAKIAMFLKLLFLESKGRKQLFLTNPPKTVYISSSRLLCAKNGDFENNKSAAVAYCWYIWENGYTGDTVLKWFN